jgi:NTE family protein
MRFYRRPVIGLALSGGGARGLAHIGVLKVLEREGIPIDCLAGTSMGGIIAAAYATGMAADEIEAEALKLARPRNLLRLIDVNIPRYGLMSGHGVRQYLIGLLGESLDFADLNIPLGLVAVDLVSGQEIVLREGLVLDAVQASGAVPVVFEPVEIGDWRLVDGGFLNNLPVDVARDLGAEVVIAVDVRLDFYDQELADDPHTPPSVRIAHNAWRAETLAGLALDSYRLAETRPDVLINPNVTADV